MKVQSSDHLPHIYFCRISTGRAVGQEQDRPKRDSGANLGLLWQAGDPTDPK